MMAALGPLVLPTARPASEPAPGATVEEGFGRLVDRIILSSPPETLPALPAEDGLIPAEDASSDDASAGDLEPAVTEGPSLGLSFPILAPSLPAKGETAPASAEVPVNARPGGKPLLPSLAQLPTATGDLTDPKQSGPSLPVSVRAPLVSEGAEPLPVSEEGWTPDTPAGVATASDPASPAEAVETDPTPPTPAEVAGFRPIEDRIGDLAVGRPVTDPVGRPMASAPAEVPAEARTVIPAERVETVEGRRRMSPAGAEVDRLTVRRGPPGLVYGQAPPHKATTPEANSVLPARVQAGERAQDAVGPEPEVPVTQDRQHDPSSTVPDAPLQDRLADPPVQIAQPPALPKPSSRTEPLAPPRSPLVQAVLDRIAPLPTASGETVVRLNPRGLGLIEVKLQERADGILDVTLRVQNPLVLEAMRLELDRVAESVLTAQGGASGSLSLDLFPSGTGQRSAEGGGQSSQTARGRATQDPAETSTDEPAPQILRADHVNIVT